MAQNPPHPPPTPRLDRPTQTVQAMLSHYDAATPQNPPYHPLNVSVSALSTASHSHAREETTERTRTPALAARIPVPCVPSANPSRREEQEGYGYVGMQERRAGTERG